MGTGKSETPDPLTSYLDHGDPERVGRECGGTLPTLTVPTVAEEGRVGRYRGVPPMVGVPWTVPGTVCGRVSRTRVGYGRTRPVSSSETGLGSGSHRTGTLELVK